MDILQLRVLYATIAFALFVGCTSNSPSQVGSMIPEGPGTQSDLKTDLLYVANFNNVIVLTYPQGKYVGTITGFNANAGECVDAKANVYVANDKPNAIFEYAHGGTKRIGKFLLEHVSAGACAFDAVTGNMAVSGASNSVDIFEPGKPKPIVISDPKMFYNEGCVYDNTGNLFVEGLRTPKGPALLSMLPKGTHKFLHLTLDATVDAESVLQWDGKYLDIVSYLPNRAHRNEPALFQFSIVGKKATKVGMTRLLGADFINHFYLYEDTAIVSNWNLKTGIKDILFYQYPQGGQPTADFRKHLTIPRGVVVSPAL